MTIQESTLQPPAETQPVITYILPQHQHQHQHNLSPRPTATASSRTRHSIRVVLIDDYREYIAIYHPNLASPLVIGILLGNWSPNGHRYYCRLIVPYIHTSFDFNYRRVPRFPEARHTPKPKPRIIGTLPHGPRSANGQESHNYCPRPSGLVRCRPRVCLAFLPFFYFLLLKNPKSAHHLEQRGSLHSLGSIIPIVTHRSPGSPTTRIFRQRRYAAPALKQAEDVASSSKKHRNCIVQLRAGERARGLFRV